MKLHKSQSGFSAVEVLLVIVVLGILGFTGYFVYHAKQNADKNLNSNPSIGSATRQKTNTNSTASNNSNSQTAVLTKYTTKVYASMFSYPSTWKLSDTSSSADEHITLTAPSGFTTNYSVSSLGHPGADYKPSVLFTHQINTKAFPNMYIDYVTGPNDQQQVLNALLSKSTTDPFDVFQSPGAYNIFVVGQSKNPETVASAKEDTDYAAFENFVKSIDFGE